MTFTPTQQGSFLAGIGLWILGWLSLFKLNQLPGLCRVFKRDKVMEWIRDHKAITLIFTEVVNFGVHGISNPEGVIFAIGGTFVNAFMVLVYIPFRLYRAAADRREALLKGVAR